MARSQVTNRQVPVTATAHASGSALNDVANRAFLNPIPGDGYQPHDIRWSGDATFAGVAVAHAPAREGAVLHAALKPATVALAHGEDLSTAMREPDGKTAASAEAWLGARSDLANGELLSDTVKSTGEILVDAASGHVEPTPFRFYFDGASDKEITGWIMRTDRPTRRCLVTLQEGDRVLARIVASRFRPDLALAGIGDGCCAFAIPMPAVLLDGAEHLLEIIEEATGLRLTADPIRWRSNCMSVEAGLSRMSEGIAGVRLADLRQQPDAGLASNAAWARRDGGIVPASVAEAPDSARQLGGVRAFARAPAVVGARVLFDVSDLVYYIGNHANLTGIQRVQSGIVLSILTHDLVPQANLIFLSFDHGTGNLVSIPIGFLMSLLEDLFLPESQRLVTFSAEEARRGVLPGATEFDGTGVLDDGNGSVLCLLGAAWVHQDYIRRVLAFKRRYGTKFVMTVHDLIPIFAPNTCDQDTVRVFDDFMRAALRHVDHILSVSEYTAKDIKRYVESLQIPEPPITVTRNGSSFAEFLPTGSLEGDFRPGGLPERFVLFVATIEGRKNHKLIFDIWRRMIEDGDDPPYLVCVGRLGWKSSAFISALVETGYLGGRVLLLRDISDTDLRMLYSRCLFTVCPTCYEGWGLPVGESLAIGKICVCSDRTSVPEVAGEFGVYIDIDNFEKSRAAIRELIVDEPARERLETRIRRGYKPITWRSVAETVVTACLAAPRIEWPAPYPYPAIPYCSEISFGRLDRHVDGSGEPLLTTIESMRRGWFLSDPLHEQSFVRGDEARSAGHWSLPEDWGTWSCHSGGEIALGLGPNESRLYYVFLRLRASTPVSDEPVELIANGENIWRGRVGDNSRDIVLRIRRNAPNAGNWRLCIRAHLHLTDAFRDRLAVIDGRMPTIGFERLIVVPENDLKTRLDVMYSMLL